MYFMFLIDSEGNELGNITKFKKIKDFSTLQKIIESCNETNDTCFDISLSYKEIYFFIDKYNIKPLKIYNEEISYGASSISLPTSKDSNYYILSSRSEYNQYRLNCCVNKIYITILINPLGKSYLNGFNIIKECDNFDINSCVFLDIETTGLNPISDDIIEIAMFDYASKKSYTSLLPLNKRKELPENISKLTNICEKDLLNAKPMDRETFIKIISKFDLYNRTICIWTGKNYFDAAFLEYYLLENGFYDLCNFKYISGIDIVKSKCKDDFNTYSKDFISRALEINDNYSHRALADCIIEAQIIDKVSNDKSYLSLESFYKKLIKEVKENFSGLANHSNELYNEFINILLRKYGKPTNDYTDISSKRGLEWIDIHHIDETVLDDIGTRTYKAILENDTNEIINLKKYNERDRLVYANKIEHFILHFLIDFIRTNECINDGVHFLFGDIIRAKINYAIFPYLERIYKRSNNYFQSIHFEEIIFLYKILLKKKHICIEQISSFWKLRDNKMIQDVVNTFIENDFFEK